MAWLLFLLFLFFAWRAAAWFGEGRPKPGVLALGACALLLAGIFADYMNSRRAGGGEAEAPASLAEAPGDGGQAIETPPDLESFYADAAPVDADAEVDVPVDDPNLVEDEFAIE